MATLTLSPGFVSASRSAISMTRLVLCNLFSVTVIVENQQEACFMESGGTQGRHSSVKLN